MRATRNNPKYSVMFIDDIGVDLAKKEGLIEQLPADKIPNMARLLKRFVFNDGYGAAFAMSSVGLVYNSATGKPLASYAELWEPRFQKRFLMTSPKATQSLYLLIARCLGRNRQALCRGAIPDRAGVGQDGAL